MKKPFHLNSLTHSANSYRWGFINKKENIKIHISTYVCLFYLRYANC